MTEAQLRCLAAVADTRSFGAAAKQLHMSQPGVSRAVMALEEELGGTLFHRGHGQAELTDLGERVLRRGRMILVEADAMRQERDELQGIASGRVRLGSMPSVSASLLPRLLGRLERRHPALAVTVIEGHDDELVEWVRSGIVDVAVVAGEPVALDRQPLVTDELVAVLPREHPLADLQHVPRERFADLPFILTRAGCERLVLKAFAESGVAPTVAHEVTEASSILALVGEDLGVSVMPSLAAGRAPRSVVLRPLRPPAWRELSLAVRPGARSPALRALLAAAAEWAAGRNDVVHR